MQVLFQYNWQVRNNWLKWCEQLSEEELLVERKGGVGNILHTLLHIIDVEYSWIRGLKGESDYEVDFSEYKTVESVKSLSDSLQIEIKQYLESWSNEMEYENVKVSWNEEEYMKGEILRHIIAHEIHHIGQLSVWSRELGLRPVSANLIGRGLMNK
ncbi:DinB family protein [Cytobacillus sp. FJAT-54145]|uniref:DinB family protein n=1 Tax=Cytobacillus spartinae TaxID=3299023 RepID=A0ABW6KF02_9BACI